MKLDVATTEVVLSNVNSTGEFKIRNSAKAFSILSSGLYSNKIRAIIRELACNAVDSHVGAGKKDIPFEVHLPSMLEPWFAVRDFGMGLDGNQVVNIYTTYFESTKTESNDFIGALGLGSKSPFSYTDNFTVTAIKHGVQRIYSAFINEEGVPSIAEMSEELTDQQNGVEVKFSVTDRSDYNTFRAETAQVFQWFTLQPIITGNSLVVQPVVYVEKNIVPGVHIRGDRTSIALMGNISYPLGNIPQVEKHFGDLASLLDCGLVIEFTIGELDFAASREQLSFIPLTLNSIKNKLELLNANLANHLALQADAIAHPWERAHFLSKQSELRLYKSAVRKYVTDTKFELYDLSQHDGKKTFQLIVAELNKTGLTLSGMLCSSSSSSKIKNHHAYINNEYVNTFNVQVDPKVVIVLNDLKIGIIAGARHHFTNYNNGHRAIVICVSHSDPDLTVRQAAYDAFLKSLHNPPVVMKASELEKKPSQPRIATNSIAHIQLKTNCRAGYSTSYMWTPSDTEFDEDETYYYVPLCNHDAIDAKGNKYDFFTIKAAMDKCGIKNISDIHVYGVRKNRIAEISNLDNWVNLTDKLTEETGKVSDTQIASLVVAEILDSYSDRVYTNAQVATNAGPDSYYSKYFEKYGRIKRIEGDVAELTMLCANYGKAVEVGKIRKEIQDTKINLYKKYPLLSHIAKADWVDIATYIKLIDKQEKTHD